LRFRLKNEDLYQVEKQLADKNIVFKVQSATTKDWEHNDVDKKVA
jgi:hypothetical protein